MPTSFPPISPAPADQPKVELETARKLKRIKCWFSEHPAFSIITYSLSIAGATWLAFFFIYDENRVSVVRAQVEVVRAQVESEKATAIQYQAKIAVLETQIAGLREDNKKYLEWLTKTPNAIPYIDEKIRVLSEENTGLKVLLASASEGSQQITPKSEGPYIVRQSLKMGEAFVDPKTNATIGIGKFYSDFTASVVLTFPGKKTETLANAKSGDNWPFVVGKSNFRLTMVKIDWYSNTAEVMIKEEEPAT